MIGKIVDHIHGVFPVEREQIRTGIVAMIKESIAAVGLGDDGDNGSFVAELKERIERMYPEIKEHQANHFIQYEIRLLSDRLRNAMSIDRLNIPVLIYQGDHEELPNIFERLNRGGTSLTKYEVFASTWSNTLVEGVDQDTARIVEDHYVDKIERTGMKIDNFSEGDILKSRKVTLYEYCFALGKRIKRRAPLLFKKNSSRRNDSVDSIGFSTLVSILGLHLKEMAKLNQYVNADVAHHRLQQLNRAILDVYEKLNEIFFDHVMEYSKYIEGQVVSLAVTLFKLKYDLDSNTLELKRAYDREDAIRSFQKYAPYRVFYDMIRNFWSGSGDNKLNDIRQAAPEDNRYTRNLSDELWRSTLTEWMTEQLKKPSKSISPESKFFISLLTRPYVDDRNVKDYRFSTIIPKKLLREKGIDHGVGHVSNLFLLPDRLKAHRNIVLTDRFEQQALFDVHHYPEKEALSFLDRHDAELGYADFLQQRIQYLTDFFVDSVKPV